MSISSFPTVLDTAMLRRLNDLADQGYLVRRESGPLHLYNYTHKAVFENAWTPETLACRGLVVNAFSGEVVARPFDRFFNWGENGRTTTAPLLRVTEKKDGSLGVGFLWLGRWRVVTRGSFDGPQAQWATAWLNAQDGNPSWWNPAYTPLFEIIYPENRIVVDYGDFAGLVLLAVRNRRTGDYLPWDEVQRLADKLDVATPAVYSLATVDDILATLAQLTPNEEGYVAEFVDGSRFKFKGDQYLLLHKTIAGLTYRRALETVAAGQVEAVRAAVPDEFLGEFDGWVAEIETTLAQVEQAIEAAFAAAPHTSRKEFAQWILSSAAPYAPYLFLRWDGRPVRPLIFRREFTARLAQAEAAQAEPIQVEGESTCGRD